MSGYNTGGRADLFKQLFRQAAGADRRLSEQEMSGLAIRLASQLRIPATVFGEVKLMFHRYDFSGDGQLDEDEGLMLIEGMMRAVKDAKDPQAAKAGMMSSRDIPTKRLEGSYALGKKLGQGGQGAVYLAKDRSNGQEKVVKFYDKSCANAPCDDIIDEFALLTKLDHPKIARTYEIFQDRANFYTVSEPYFGGDLSTIVEKASQGGAQITEKWFAGIWSQSCQGVAFLHTQHVMHCDIKEANIMISSKGNFQNPNVVVIDFGLAQGFSAGQMAGGTPGYMPPEVWQMGLWTPKGDTFAMGVTFYSMIMMGQGGPWTQNAQSIEQVTANTVRCMMPPPQGYFQRSPALYRMVSRMLNRDFHARPNIGAVLDDPWMKSASGDSMDVDTGALRRMSKMAEMSQLQKGLLADMASKENLAQLEEISATFVSMDENNDGLVDANEARQALRGKLPAAEIEALIGSLIGDGNGKVSYTVFMGSMIAARKGNSSQMLWKIFQELDDDNNGYLCQNELRAMMDRDQVKELMGNKSAQQALAEFGWDRKERVTWEDFRMGFEKSSTPGGVASPFQEGQDVEYYSPSYGKWVPCKVVNTRGDGAITINIKAGFWIKLADQQKKVRAPGGPQASPGLNLLQGAMGM